MQTFARALRISQLRSSHSLSPASKRNLLVLPAVKCRSWSTPTRSFTCSARTLDNSHEPRDESTSTQTDTTSVSKQNVDKASSGAEQSRYHVLNSESPYSAPPSQNSHSASSSSNATQTDTTSVSKSDVDTANSVASQTPPYSPQPQTHTQTQTQTLTQPDEPRLSLTFTCTVPQCETRSTHEFTKRSYERGIVIVQCPGCKNR